MNAKIAAMVNAVHEFFGPEFRIVYQENMNDDDQLFITFRDKTLVITGEWHNDRTAGIRFEIKP